MAMWFILKCATMFLQLCLSQKIRYLVSPYEVDAQIAFLLKHGFVDFAITEDSDLLAYGCENVICFVYSIFKLLSR